MGLLKEQKQSPLCREDNLLCLQGMIWCAWREGLAAQGELRLPAKCKVENGFSYEVVAVAEQLAFVH